MTKTPEEIKKERSEINRRYYLKHKDDIKNSDSFKRAQKNFTQSQKGKEASKRARAAIMADPIKKERYYQRNKEWRKNNPEKAKAAQQLCDMRRRYKKRLMQLILSPKEREEIKQFYMNCPKGYHVDHIIPICKGGNHTIDNLQYLTARENLEKSGKWIGVEDGECYDPDFLLKRLENEFEEDFVIYILNYEKEDKCK